MTEDKSKVALGVGLAAAGLGLGLLLLKKPEPPAEVAAVIITVYDAAGNVVPANSPVSLEEGGSYSFDFTVLNQTTRGGEPWPATFDILYQVLIAGDLRVRDTVITSFAAGEQKSFGPFPFSVLWDTGGLAGAIDVIVQDPGGGIVASGTEMISVISVRIIYGATVVIGV